jgi:hypothetical protein
MTPISNPSGSTVRPVEGTSFDAARVPNTSHAAGQPPRSVDLAPRGGPADASMRPRAALPSLSRQVSSQGDEIREEAAEVRQATVATRGRGPTLGDLFAPERRQEATAQLVHSALPNGGAVMKRLKDRAARQRPSTNAEKWHALRNGKPKPLDGNRRMAFEALIHADVMALAETGQIDFSAAAATMRAAVMDGTLGHGILEPDRQLLLEVLDLTRERSPTLEELLAPERGQDATARKERVQLVHSALPNGGKVMERLKDRAARQRPSTVAEKCHAFRNEKPKPLDGERRNAFDELILADVMDLAETGKMDFWVAAATMHAAVVEGTLGHGILAPDRQLLLERLDVMARHVANCYESKNLKVTSDTLPAFTDIQVVEKPTMLGSGVLNNVFAVKLRNPDGNVFDGVFKPLSRTDESWAAEATGIPEDDPQTAMRNIATRSYAEELGFDVIVNTQLALIDTGSCGPELGLIMERARGKLAFDTNANVLTRPDVCAEVTKLQLLDHLTAQGDRHSDNYFINIQPNCRAKVMGIDNDQCFGKNVTDPAGIQQVKDDPKRDGFRGTGLPPVVDTEMEHAINRLTERDIRWMLGNKLSEAEIEAAISRHKGVKNHIAQLRSAGWVIEPEQWDQEDVLRRLNAKNSYVGRERVVDLRWQAECRGNIFSVPHRMDVAKPVPDEVRSEPIPRKNIW